MKHRFNIYFLSSLVFFFIIACFWIIFKVENIYLLYLFLGLTIGSFLLDIDHVIYWFFLKPKTEESRLVKLAFQNKDFKAIIKIIQTSHQTHHSLIFHHYFFQVILTLFSLFIITSTQNTIIASLVLGLNLHLVIDEIIDFRKDPKTLQKWLFAREPKQLPLSLLKKYISIFVFFIFLFTFLIIRSRI